MRIITTRRLRFYNSDRTQNFVTEGKNVIQDCPDWAEQDDMFKLALENGILQVIGSRSVQKVLENDLVLPQNAHEAKQFMESTEEVHMDNNEGDEKSSKRKRSRKRKDKE